MSNLHFILLNADSAQEAASFAKALIRDRGNENHWGRVGGVASEDGGDDIENYEGGTWPLSFFDREGESQEGTSFARAVASLRQTIIGSMTLKGFSPCAYPDLRAAFHGLSDILRNFDPDAGHTPDLWVISRNINYLFEITESRRAIQQGVEIPQFYAEQFDQYGLTDMTEQIEETRRYLVFLDMHA